jgi:hypothetical protein
MANPISRFFRRVRRMWNDNLLASSKALTIVVLFEFVAIFILAVYEVASPQSTVKCFSKQGVLEACSLTYGLSMSLIHVLNAIFLCISAIDGIFYDNLYELYAAMFQALLSTSLGIFKFVEPYKNDWVDYGFLLVTCACQLVYFAVAYSLRQEYTWRLYRKAGADKTFRLIFKQYLIMKTFSKLDIMFGIINVVCAGLAVLSNVVAAAIAWSMLAYYIIFHIVGTYAVKFEITRLTMVYFSMFAVSPAYFVYMLVVMYRMLEFDDSYDAKTLAYMFTLTALLAFIIHIALFVFAFITYRNYGRGLKNLEFLRKNKKSDANADDDDLQDLDEDVDYVEYDESKRGEMGESDFSLFDVIRNTYAIDKSQTVKT